MCEIVRAMVANGKFSTVTDNVLNIPLEITDYIDCPGNEGLFNKFRSDRNMCSYIIIFSKER
jgi:hypothetical protein